MDWKSIGMGAVAGYILGMMAAKAQQERQAKEANEATANSLGALHMGALHANPNHMGAIHANPYGAIQMGAIHQNPHSALDQTQAYPHAARAPWGYGALHMGALAQQ